MTAELTPDQVAVYLESSCALIEAELTALGEDAAWHQAPGEWCAREVVGHLIEHPHPDAPYGAKGVGEPPTISSTPAIVAAIRAATGRDLDRVPVRPDDIVFGEASLSVWRLTPGSDPRTATRG